jgi:hypothetical protein
VGGAAGGVEGVYLFYGDLVPGEFCCAVFVVEIDEFLCQAGDEFWMDGIDDDRVRRHFRRLFGESGGVIRKRCRSILRV